MRTEGELVHNENAYVKSVNRLNYFCIGAVLASVTCRTDPARLSFFPGKRRCTKWFQ